MNQKVKIIGVVPARMAASRFPGKPLHPIHGRPMIEHVLQRAKMYGKWDGLYLATCDREIEDYAKTKGWNVIMTSDKHTRCLDRVAEAVQKCGLTVNPEDIIVCVQGDEPMLEPKMIEATVEPLLMDSTVPTTVLAMDIVDEEVFHSPNVVKIVANQKGDAVYSSRAPVPFCKGAFTPALGAKRIYGIFAFRWKYLKEFTEMSETRLEQIESCDTNRILDAGYKQRIAPYPNQKSFSVDCPEDIHLVEEHMKADVLWGTY